MYQSNDTKYSQRFWSRVERGDPDACWLWKGSTAGQMGYGHLHVDGKDRYAHRLAYELHSGEIPAGLMVLHRCDNPRCVNPSHLFLGTAADNARDRESKGRGLRGRPSRVRGERQWSAKLTAADVSRIREMSKTMSGRSIARAYGVAHTTIQAVLRCRTWKHIEEGRDA